MMVMILVGAEHDLTTDKGHGIGLTWLGQPEQLFVEIEQKSPHIQRIDVAEHVAILTPLRPQGYLSAATPGTVLFAASHVIMSHTDIGLAAKSNTFITSMRYSSLKRVPAFFQNAVA